MPQFVMEGFANAGGEAFAYEFQRDFGGLCFFTNHAEKVDFVEGAPMGCFARLEFCEVDQGKCFFRGVGYSVEFKEEASRAGSWIRRMECFDALDCGFLFALETLGVGEAEEIGIKAVRGGVSGKPGGDVVEYLVRFWEYPKEDWNRKRFVSGGQFMGHHDEPFISKSD